MEKTCSFCENIFSLKEHSTGLVLNDEHFICTNCCQNNDINKIKTWAIVKSDELPKLRPIHIWMLEQESKD